jgi:predicted nucleotidyltransferase component of viral defense system
MREQAVAISRDGAHYAEKLNLLREYLQAYILRSFHESEAFSAIAFMGGTALRFLYNLPRFSEDLDFSVEFPQMYHIERWMKKLKRDFAYGNFDATMKLNSKQTVHKAWISVKGILKEAGLSGHAAENVSVKIEIDTAPPAGANMKRTAVTKHFLFALHHHDLPTLMAGKICAICSRAYPKGRDYYDLFWYLSQRPPITPNLKFLDAALRQMEQHPEPICQWPQRLMHHFSSVDWEELIKDVEPFLERPEDRHFLTPDYLHALVDRMNHGG